MDYFVFTVLSAILALSSAACVKFISRESKGMMEAHLFLHSFSGYAKQDLEFPR
jgi:hypothetical protein